MAEHLAMQQRFQAALKKRVFFGFILFVTETSFLYGIDI